MRSLKKLLGANIRKARRRLGTTQEQMAELLRMSPEVYGRLERGLIFPRMERFVDICEKLGESPDRLLGFTAPEALAAKPATRQDEWLSVMQRLTPVMPRLTSPQSMAVRRHVLGLHRLLTTFIHPAEGRAARSRKGDPTS
ncbi:MAG: helix-turn-helix transcriptional regulator [Myxococcaceae bacterium]|nr:helix-turn-helix transcriptional regulator [Myxococcaceae bacterium]